MRRLPLKKPELQPDVDLRKKWAELIPDDMPAEMCKKIFYEILGKMDRGEKLTAQSNQEEPPF